MYPVFRFAKEMTFNARPASLGLFETHVSRHICWPWDLDPWMELNNGRTLTLLDLGRIPMAGRMGMLRAAFGNGWGVTVAGLSMRYRRRVRAFHRFEMHSRLIGWDDRFLYLEQAMVRHGIHLNHLLCRWAITGKEGIVPPAELLEKMGHDPAPPELPVWVQSWIEAEALRPWPPMT